MARVNQGDGEIKKLKRLLKEYSVLAKASQAIEDTIYQILKSRLRIAFEKESRTAFIFIEGMSISRREQKAIKSILEKRGYQFQEAA